VTRASEELDDTIGSDHHRCGRRRGDGKRYGMGGRSGGRSGAAVLLQGTDLLTYSAAQDLGKVVFIFLFGYS
jgi:hypothetical protein